MASGLSIPPSVTDPTLHAFLEQLVNTIGGLNPNISPTPGLGTATRIKEDRYPNNQSPVMQLIQFKLQQLWTTVAAIGPDGSIFLTSASPATSKAFTNSLVAASMAKCWGAVTLGASPAVTIDAGFNIAAVSYVSPNITITMASPMTSANYSVTATPGGGLVATLTYSITSTSMFVITSSAAIGPTNKLSFHVFGNQ